MRIHYHEEASALRHILHAHPERAAHAFFLTLINLPEVGPVPAVDCGCDCCEVWLRYMKVSVMSIAAPHRAADLMTLVEHNDPEVYRLIHSLLDDIKGLFSRHRHH